MERTRTVDPCWGRLDFLWNGCDEQEYTETYTDTETDYGRKLLGSAVMVAGAGMFTGGFIAIIVRKPSAHQRHRSRAHRQNDGFSIAWAGSF